MMLMRRSFEQVVCAVVFCVLTFCYLYNYQADVLVVTQFLASGGQTHYHVRIAAPAGRGPVLCPPSP